MKDDRGQRLAWALLLAGVGLLAFGVRFGLMARSGLLNVGGYDDGVHYAAAVNLVHGRLPYRDVEFLQPPGVAVATAPFAALAPVVGDPVAFVLAKVAFMLVGALNAVVTAAVLRRSGPAAALVGGVLYAVAAAIVYDERTVTVEPLGTLGGLVALLLLPRARTLGGRWAVLAGVAAGLAVGFKIWYVVPFVVLLAWARGHRWRFLLGGAAGGAALYLPFFLAAPGPMWSQVVLAQLGRPDLGTTPIGVRLDSILGVAGAGGPSPLAGVDAAVLTPVIAVVAALLLVVVLIGRRTRVIGVLAVADLAVLLLSPSYFQHYAVLVAAPLALVAGAATGVVLRRVPSGPVRGAVVALVLTAAVTLNLAHDTATVGVRAPLRDLAAAAARVDGCVLSDSPDVLAGMGVLTPEVAAGCDVRSDPTGSSYTGLRYLVDGSPVGRDQNPVFQRGIVQYLTSAEAYVIVRWGALELDRVNSDALRIGRPVVTDGRFTLYRTP